MSLRSCLRAVVVGVLAAGVALSATATLAADPQTNNPAQAIVLSGKLSGSLPAAPVGGWAGSNNNAGLAYYKFDYAGDNSTVTINVQVYPDDETILQNVGFSVYGPKSVSNPGFSYVTGGAQPKLQPNVSADLNSNDRGTYTVQLFNDSQVAIDFSIWATGLAPQVVTLVPTAAPQAAAPAVPTPAPSVAAPTVPAPAPPIASPAPAAPAAQPGATPTPTEHQVAGGKMVAGTLNPGASDLFQFDYPGDESVYTLDEQASPDDATVLQSTGFQVFTPTGALQVKGGPQQSLRPNVSGNVISKVPGTYTVKVYNDNTNVMVTYTLTLVTNPPAPK